MRRAFVDPRIDNDEKVASNKHIQLFRTRRQKRGDARYTKSIYALLSRSIV